MFIQDSLILIRCTLEDVVQLRKIHDISMKVEKSMIVYPGNPVPSLRQYSMIPENATNESMICIGSHTGSHVDAGLHVKNGGYVTDDIPLGNFYGPCRVADLTGAGENIDDVDLEPLNLKAGEIILLKTENSIMGYGSFRENFAHVSRSGADLLIAKKVKTLGIDYLSVKKFGADNDVHLDLIDNMTIIEGLDLSSVHPGNYLFCGFPVKLDSDASPIRAVLIEE